MSPEQQFWWNWWAQAAVAVGTLALAVAAIGGRRIESWLFPPKLVLSLLNEDGTLTKETLRLLDGTMRQEDARYYHLHILNNAMWSKATNMQVILFASVEI
jgi:hypothetical protein